jgi:hypothetical protein
LSLPNFSESSIVNSFNFNRHISICSKC